MLKTNSPVETMRNSDEIKQERSTPWYVLNSPEMGKPFADFYEACRISGVLNKKIKELLKVAVTSTYRCPHCMDEQIQAALDAGVSREEITEALLIAAVTAAGIQLNGGGCLSKTL